MGEEAYLTIGKVVAKLQGQYPDLSVSKVRYLEEEGLLTPRRTSGGYRMYSMRDLQRLERILHLQKTRFLPLAVIRNVLNQEEVTAAPSLTSVTDNAPANTQDELQAEDEIDPTCVDEDLLGKLHSIDRIPDLLGVSISFVRQLAETGIISLTNSPQGRDLVDGKDFKIIRACDELQHLGIAPKNLRQYVNAANRESALFEQVLAAYTRHGISSDEHRKQAIDAFTNVLKLTNNLRSQLIRRIVGERFKDIV